MMKLSRKVKILRQSRGLNQADFGKLVGNVDQSTISKWERDLQEPRGEALLLLAGLAEESPAEFLGLERRSPPIEETKEPRPMHHPAFGCMKDTLTILPGVDLTEPADPDWGKVYDDPSYGQEYEK
ncbi:MAG: helix-turn-helix transcriptional regulator [Devosia sp.]